VASHEPASDDTTVEVPHVVTFRTQTVTDTQAPEVSGLVIVKVLDDTMVQIQWQTDEIADSRVQYNSKGKSLSKSAGSLSRSKNHKAILTNLTYGERYGFKVSSQDIYGNRYESGVMEFTTKEDSVHSASDNQESQGGGGIGLVMIMSLLLFNLQAGWRREGGDLCLSVSRLLNWRPWAS
jgi:hypothetical protein